MSIELMQVTTTDTITGEVETGQAFSPESAAELKRMFELTHLEFSDMINILALERAERAKKREDFLIWARADAISREFFNQ